MPGRLKADTGLWEESGSSHSIIPPRISHRSEEIAVEAQSPQIQDGVTDLSIHSRKAKGPRICENKAPVQMVLLTSETSGYRKRLKNEWKAAARFKRHNSGVKKGVMRMLK